ncbi:hypothetical protein FRC17_001453 [Serendipita sp. 399]|nr:hypothetical protein FRC17_001453 [Serendipita sp. 399]
MSNHIDDDSWKALLAEWDLLKEPQKVHDQAAEDRAAACEGEWNELVEYLSQDGGPMPPGIHCDTSLRPQYTPQYTANQPIFPLNTFEPEWQYPNLEELLGTATSTECDVGTTPFPLAGGDYASSSNAYPTPSLYVSDGISPSTYASPSDCTPANFSQDFSCRHDKDGISAHWISLPSGHAGLGTPTDLNAAVDTSAEGGHGGGHPEGVRSDTTNQETTVQQSPHTSESDTQPTTVHERGYADPVDIYNRILNGTVTTKRYEAFYPKGREHGEKNGGIVCNLDASLSKSGLLKWTQPSKPCGKEFPHEPSYRRHIEEQHLGRKRPRTTNPYGKEAKGKEAKAVRTPHVENQKKMDLFQARYFEHTMAVKQRDERKKRERSEEEEEDDDTQRAGPSKRRRLD